MLAPTPHRVIVIFSNPSVSLMLTVPSIKPSAKRSPSELQSADRILA